MPLSATAVFAPQAPGSLRHEIGDLLPLIADRAAEAREVLQTLYAAPTGTAPVDEYISSLANWRAAGAYNRMPPEAAQLVAQLHGAGGTEFVAAVHRLAIPSMLLTHPGMVAPSPYTPTRDQFRRVVTDILNQLPSAPDERLTHQADAFRKDLAVCSARLLCCGVRAIDPRQGLARRDVFGSGVTTALRGAAAIARLGGLGPLYATHLYHRTTRRFMEEDYLSTLRTIAGLLERDPACRGVYSSAWFSDPAVSDISPHLAFLGEVHARSGAMVMRIRNASSTVSSAISKSATRRALYEAGRYVPAQYLVIWTRERLLRWSAAEFA